MVSIRAILVFISLSIALNAEIALAQSNETFYLAPVLDNQFVQMNCTLDEIANHNFDFESKNFLGYWSCPDGTIMKFDSISEDGRRRTFNNGSLVIYNIDPPDIGSYRCFGDTVNNDINVNIHGSQSIISQQHIIPYLITRKNYLKSFGIAAGSSAAFLVIVLLLYLLHEHSYDRIHAENDGAVTISVEPTMNHDPDSSTYGSLRNRNQIQPIQETRLRFGYDDDVSAVSSKRGGAASGSVIGGQDIPMHTTVWGRQEGSVY